MCDTEGKKTNIQQLPVTKGMKTLGVTLAPDGNNIDLVTSLEDKANEWADLILTGHLQKEEAWRAMQSTIIRSLEYPLVATTLTEIETEKIFAPIRQAALPQCGIVRTFPKAITHAPLKHQGLDITSLHTSQYVQHIMTLLKFGGTNTVTGKLIAQSLELLKLEIGISRPLQDIKLHKIAHLATDTWTKSTWLFLEKHSLQINEQPQFMLRRDGDAYLMDILFDSDLPTALFPALNRCRLYHKILTLSDLATGRGDKVRSYYWTPTHISHDDRSGWPTQGSPSKSDWQTWRRCLMTLFDLRATDGVITHQLQQGEGRVTPTWQWYHFQDSIYELKDGTWRRYSQIGSRRSRIKRYSQIAMNVTKPTQALPCTVEKDGQRVIMTGTIQPEQDIQTIQKDPPFGAYIQELLNKDDRYKWIYDYVPTPSEDQLNRIKVAIETNELYGCTDSSVKDGIATASFAFQIPEQGIVLQGETVIPGYPSIQGAYRGEMGGAAAALHYLSTIIKYKGISTGSVQLGCDSDGVIKIGLTQTSNTNSVADHYDLIRLCRRSRTDMHSIKIVPVIVKGHTDKLHRRKTNMEKLNIICDKRAGLMRKKVQQKNLHIQPGHIQHWQLSYKGMPINSKLETSLKDIIHADRSLDYWTEQSATPLCPSTTGHIDWKAIGTAMRKSSLYKRHFVSKHSTGHCGVGKMMKHWGFRTNSSCPRCNAPDESSAHVILSLKTMAGAN